MLQLLSHEVRWRLLSALARSDYKVQELMQIVNRPQNLVSYHLRCLRQAHLVDERRSSADGRDVYYHLDLERLRESYQAGGRALHPALVPARGRQQADAPRRGLTRVLFLCTHNSARSQMAEGLLRARQVPGLEVASAGSEPAGVHPLAVETMAGFGIDISRQQSTNVDDLAGQAFDLVITVCDRMREVCPVFPQGTQQIHWSIADPSEAPGSMADRRAAFQRVADELATRIEFLLIN